MSDDRALEDVIARVADGETVDWDHLRTREASPMDPALLDALRILGNVASAHRGIADGSPDALLELAPRAVRWGKYVLTDRLGAGSFGDVYCAWDSSLRRDVAIKLLRPVAGAHLIRQRLLEEGQRLASVRHPNVVSVLEVEEHDGRLGLCMEFVRGRTLHEVVRLEGTLSAREAARIGVDVCSALEAVHAKNVIHRDVKPNNVVREDSGRIVLMDFGSGIQLLNQRHLHPTSVGTPLYMAPELFDGQPATELTDVYSVGVLLYFLVSGRHPVEGSTLEQIRRGHRTEGSRPLAEVCPDLPAGFIEVVERALSPAPATRAQNATELRRELDGVLKALARRRNVLQIGAGVLTGSAGIAALIVLLGHLTSATYEFLLDISPVFATDTLADDFRWGIKSLVAPSAMAALVSGVLYLLLECWALAQKISVRCRAWGRQIHKAFSRLSFARQIGLRDWARIALLASVAFLVWVPLIGFPEFVRAFVSEPLTTAPPETLRILGPPGTSVQDAYRQGLSAALTVMSVAWMTLWRSARRSGISLGAAGWMGLASLVSTLVVLDLPYRIVHHTEAERARYEGSACYITGRSPSAYLLFCPFRAPRIVSVNRADPSVIATGTVGSLFETVR